MDWPVNCRKPIGLIGRSLASWKTMLALPVCLNVLSCPLHKMAGEGDALGLVQITYAPFPELRTQKT